MSSLSLTEQQQLDNPLFLTMPLAQHLTVLLVSLAHRILAKQALEARDGLGVLRVRLLASIHDAV